MTAASKSKTKVRAKSTSGLDKVMHAVANAGSSLSSMVKDNVMAAEKFVTGGRSKPRSTKSSRKRKAVAA